MLKKLLPLITLQIILFWHILANATIMLHVPIKQLLTESESIVYGKVISKQSFINKENSNINTTIQIEVIRWLKGSGEKQINIIKYGGKLDSKMSFIPGDAKFEADEEVVVIIHKIHGELFLTSLAQSKFKVYTHPLSRK